jgi:hypothetical protein
MGDVTAKLDGFLPNLGLAHSQRIEHSIVDLCLWDHMQMQIVQLQLQIRFSPLLRLRLRWNLVCKNSLSMCHFSIANGRVVDTKKIPERIP